MTIELFNTIILLPSLRLVCKNWKGIQILYFLKKDSKSLSDTETSNG